LIEHLGQSLFALGAAYLVCLFIGKLTSKAHLPRVTGYLFVGILVGPSLAHLLGYPALLGESELVDLEVLSQVALALIMLTIGGQFRFESLRKWGKRLAVLSMTEIIVTMLFISIPIFLFNFFIAQSIYDGTNSVFSSSLYLAVFNAVIAVATAPAATLLVIREYESQGPVTDLTLSLIGLNNLFSIIVFSFCIHFFFVSDSSIFALLARIGEPILIGFGIGVLLSVWGQRLESKTEMQLLIGGSAVALLGISHVLNIDMFLACFIAGMTVSNASPKSANLFQALKSIDYPLYVIFFVIAGASLHIEALSHLGLLGLLYIVARTAGKVFGAWLGSRLGNFGETQQRWLGMALLAQAGVALGLSQTLVNVWPEGGQVAQTLTLGSFVIFELIGPVAVRRSLVSAGEVPVLTLYRKQAPETAMEGLHHVIKHFRHSLGLHQNQKVNDQKDIPVESIMRRNVETVCENVRFNELLRLVSHTKYDRFPVTNQNNEYIGVIDYADIRDVLVDETLAALIVARDLVKPEPLSVSPDQTLGQVFEIFQTYSDISYLPVVEGENPVKLIGIISQNDVLATFHIPGRES